MEEWIHSISVTCIHSSGVSKLSALDLVQIEQMFHTQWGKNSVTVLLLGESSFAFRSRMELTPLSYTYRNGYYKLRVGHPEGFSLLLVFSLEVSLQCWQMYWKQVRPAPATEQTAVTSQFRHKSDNTRELWDVGKMLHCSLFLIQHVSLLRKCMTMWRIGPFSRSDGSFHF